MERRYINIYCCIKSNEDRPADVSNLFRLRGEGSKEVVGDLIRDADGQSCDPHSLETVDERLDRGVRWVWVWPIRDDYSPVGGSESIPVLTVEEDLVLEGGETGSDVRPTSTDVRDVVDGRQKRILVCVSVLDQIGLSQVMVS